MWAPQIDSAFGGVVTILEFEIAVERHDDGFVAYLRNVNAAVVGEGDTFEEAVDDLKSAIAFHVETFGPDSLQGDES
jgi:predicted RNase H-like HicB family nuclease